MGLDLNINNSFTRS